jgi:hypothetical protein
VEKQPPVAECDVLGKRHGEGLGVGQCPLVAQALLLDRTSEFGGGRGFARETSFDHLDHALANAIQRVALIDHRAEDHKTGLARVHGVGKNLRGQARLDQRPVETTVWRVAQHFRSHADGVGIGMQARRRPIGQSHELDLALAPDHELTLAIGRGLDGPVLRQSTRSGFGSLPKVLTIQCSACCSSNLPATVSTALSGW